MKVTYNGPYESVTVEPPGALPVVFAKGESQDVDKALGKSLCEQEDFSESKARRKKSTRKSTRKSTTTNTGETTPPPVPASTDSTSTSTGADAGGKE